MYAREQVYNKYDLYKPRAAYAAYPELENLKNINIRKIQFHLFFACFGNVTFKSFKTQY
jgi:hypothetical protein